MIVVQEVLVLSASETWCGWVSRLGEVRPVVLVGTSYTRAHRVGFSRWLVCCCGVMCAHGSLRSFSGFACPSLVLIWVRSGGSGSVC